MYLAVVVPRMLYGADVFLGPALRCKSFKDRKGGHAALGKLAAIQRSTALMIVGGLHTSPNDLLDMHAKAPGHTEEKITKKQISSTSRIQP